MLDRLFNVGLSWRFTTTTPVGIVTTPIGVVVACTCATTRTVSTAGAVICIVASSTPVGVVASLSWSVTCWPVNGCGVCVAALCLTRTCTGWPVRIALATTRLITVALNPVNGSAVALTFAWSPVGGCALALWLCTTALIGLIGTANRAFTTTTDAFAFFLIGAAVATSLTGVINRQLNFTKNFKAA